MRAIPVLNEGYIYVGGGSLRWLQEEGFLAVLLNIRMPVFAGLPAVSVTQRRQDSERICQRGFYIMLTG
jgi:hypothetical protein